MRNNDVKIKASEEVNIKYYTEMVTITYIYVYTVNKLKLRAYEHHFRLSQLREFSRRLQDSMDVRNKWILMF